ncbi:uncharacterized protein LOC135476662 isoform X2 [Liolophura sinensis]|uniref:uncharacterized protein LOC135476662 isoform X2 n=1 Tax=Liolophura sinensis TaxID=3198878 RepID=UPI003158026F
MKGILCAVIFIGIASGQSRVPIPATPLGHAYKGVPASAQIHIEFFIDLLCPDSKAAFPVLKQVGDHYGNSVRISTIQFPLPYHRNAFLAAMGVQVVHNMTNGNVNKVYEWMGLIFDNMDQFGGSVNYNVPENKTVGDFAALAGGMGLSTSHFADLLVNDGSMNMATRVDWKYGCTLMKTRRIPVPRRVGMYVRGRLAL